MISERGNIFVGFTGVLLTASLAAFLSIINSNVALVEMQQKVATQTEQSLMQYINIQQSCYSDKRDWCSANELEEYGLSDNLTQQLNAEVELLGNGNLALEIPVQSEKIAKLLVPKFLGTSVNGHKLSLLVEPPSKHHLHQDRIQRYKDDEFGRNKLEQGIDLNNFNLPNINLAEAQFGRFQSLNSEKQAADDVHIERQLELGGNSVSFYDESVNIQSNLAEFTGEAVIGGDIINAENIIGVNAVNGKHLESHTVKSGSAKFGKVYGDKSSYVTGHIKRLYSDNFSSTNTTMVKLESNKVISKDVNASGEVKSESLSVGDLGFVRGYSANWNSDNAKTRSLSSTEAFLGDATASGFDVATTASADKNTANKLVINRNLSVSGNMRAGSFSGNDFNSGSGSVNQNYYKANQNKLDINGTSNSISSTSSGISYTGFKVSQNTQVLPSIGRDISANTSNLHTSNSASIQNKNRSNLVESSLASTESKLGIWKTRLDRCMYVTQYCIPQDPKASISCSNCSQSSYSSTFSANASALIDSCRQGCQYSWSVTGVTGSCSSGSVPPGGSVTASCTVSASNVGPQETQSGSVTLTVRNSHYTGRYATDSVNVSFFNRTVPRPTVSTSCSGCSLSGRRSSFGGSVFSSISNCPHGCSYSWSVSGAASYNCPSGSVAAGRTASPSCSISGSVGAEQSISGSVTLNVRNSRFTSYSSSDSESYFWRNETPKLKRCPSKGFNVPVRGGVQTKFVYIHFDGGTVGQTQTKEPSGWMWNCGRRGHVSHIEGDATVRCESNSQLSLIRSGVYCIGD